MRYGWTEVHSVVKHSQFKTRPLDCFCIMALHAQLRSQAPRSQWFWHRNGGKTVSEKGSRAQRRTPHTGSTKLPESQVKTTSSQANRVVTKRSKALSALVAGSNVSSALRVKDQAGVLQGGMTEFGCLRIFHSDLLPLSKCSLLKTGPWPCPAWPLCKR